MWAGRASAALCELRFRVLQHVHTYIYLIMHADLWCQGQDLQVTEHMHMSI